MTNDDANPHNPPETFASFYDTLLHALEHFTDPAKLGEESPLAEPYLLGEYLHTGVVDAKTRGRILQQVLQEALTEVDGEDAELHRRIIYERYFRGQSATGVSQLVTLGKTLYHSHQKRAVARFEAYVFAKLNPTIRLESPLRLAAQLLDRDQAITRCASALQKKQTVMLMGSGGTGKTSMGSQIARTWGQPVFWFTVRPGINDHLTSFLFELAYFCHLHSASMLWLELLANNGKIAVARLPAIVRHTLEKLPSTPLLCIDEADLLKPSTQGDHAQLSQLLVSLRTLVPLLVVGQDAALESDHYETLSGLSPLVSNIFLKQQQVILDESAQRQLQTYTDGNPRLLQLLITLQQSGESINTLLGELHSNPTVQFLLGRILQRLQDAEIGILMELAVIQVPAPVDEWQKDAQRAHALRQLTEKRLVQQDEQGGIFLLPAYRDVIVRELPSEKAAHLHQRAARLFQRRGRYTLAAHHYSLTSSPEVAVWMWRDVQQEEINRGQAYPALQLFRTIEAMPLSQNARDQVKIFCATLENLIGNVTKAQADLRSILGKTPLLQIEADEKAAVIASNLSEFDEAERLFRRAMLTGEQMVEVRLAHIHKGLGWRYYSERELDRAWQQVSLAQYEVVNLQGTIQYARCNYAAAIEHYGAALELAQTLVHNDGIAKSANLLGLIYTKLGQFNEAGAFYNLAEETNQRLGKMVALDGLKINRGLLNNLAGNHAATTKLLLALVETKSKEGFPLSPIMRALIYHTLAEAFLGLEELEQAETYVQLAIGEEEIAILPDSLRTYGEIKFK